MSPRLTTCCLPLLLGMWLPGCGPSDGPQTGGLTNWLQVCRVDADCGDFECVCGACTRPCDTEDVCGGLSGASCVPADDAGAVALCGGEEESVSGICLARCEDQSCPTGTACVAGVCSPLPDPTATVVVDTESRFQTLVGFGASLAYSDDSIVAHPAESELLDAMFADSGLDVLRFRNRFGESDTALAAQGEILQAAADRMGAAPMTLMTSGSPPAELKANGARDCSGNPDTCTLATLPDGTFDYAGFGAFWRSSLDAYVAAGIVPDYVSIQNNPNWVPPDSETLEACRFLPAEGTATVTVGGTPVDVVYPGYAEALAAVLQALDGLSPLPKIAAPEVTAFDQVDDYAAALDFANVDAIAHHMYGTDPAAVDEAGLAALGDLAHDLDRPLFQTEMRSVGFDTAVLLHYVMAVEGASVYMQNDFVGSTSSLGEETLALISLEEDTFATEAPYHAMRHFAWHTDPGWVRIDAASSSEDLLSSAWLSPEEDALTIVLVNAGLSEIAMQLDVDAIPPALFANTEVTRTTFEGIERSANLGVLAEQAIVRVPGHSIVTVAFWE